jgi:uncharacterized membrane protein (DUF2068 family)
VRGHGRIVELPFIESPLMAENTTMSVVKKCAPTLYLIIADKLFKGVLSLLLAFGVYKMAGVDLSDLFDRLVRWVHLDPEDRFLTNLGDLIDQITPANMRWVATGTLLYSLFSLIEGLGLIFRAKWAIWLAIGESAFFIPIEIYELVRRHVLNHPRPELLGHPKLGLLMVLACNVLIVLYLYANRKRLLRHGH